MPFTDIPLGNAGMLHADIPEPFPFDIRNGAVKTGEFQAQIFLPSGVAFVLHPTETPVYQGSLSFTGWVNVTAAAGDTVYLNVWKDNSSSGGGDPSVLRWDITTGQKTGFNFMLNVPLAVIVNSNIGPVVVQVFHGPFCVGGGGAASGYTGTVLYVSGSTYSTGNGKYVNTYRVLEVANGLIVGERAAVADDIEDDETRHTGETEEVFAAVYESL